MVCYSFVNILCPICKQSRNINHSSLTFNRSRVGRSWHCVISPEFYACDSYIIRKRGLAFLNFTWLTLNGLVFLGLAYVLVANFKDLMFFSLTVIWINVVQLSVDDFWCAFRSMYMAMYFRLTYMTRFVKIWQYKWIGQSTNISPDEYNETKLSAIDGWYVAGK